MLRGTGAGREYGRLRLFCNIQQVVDAVRHALASMLWAPRWSMVRIFVMAGVGGGTGSGTFLDLAYIARTLGNETLCRACCANAEAATGYASDAWSQKNVAALHMPVIEKAEPLVSPEVSTPATANPPVESNMEPDITPAVQGVRSIVINADADGLGI